jgi:hypothetical protein
VKMEVDVRKHSKEKRIRREKRRGKRKEVKR